MAARPASDGSRRKAGSSSSSRRWSRSSGRGCANWATQLDGSIGAERVGLLVAERPGNSFARLVNLVLHPLVVDDGQHLAVDLDVVLDRRAEECRRPDDGREIALVEADRLRAEDDGRRRARSHTRGSRDASDPTEDSNVGMVVSGASNDL